MKKYILLLITLLCLTACEEDESRDITVMPPATEKGADTFGCLVDGWLYVGGRYQPLGFPDVLSSIEFIHHTEANEISVSVWVKRDQNITFSILSPEKGKECALTNITFGEEKLQDGTAFISRYDPSSHIISGTFTNGGRLTHGRFDVHYSERNY